MMPPIFDSSCEAATLPPRLKMTAASKRRHRHRRNVGDAAGSSCAAAAFSAQMSSHKWLLTCVLLGLIVAAASAADETRSTEKKTVQPSPAAPLSTLSSSFVAPRDEIYIDDEGIEGSGGRGELHDDLEKEEDFSGSGFGPDDEDSSTDSHTHHRRPSIPTDTGNSRQSSSYDNDLLSTSNNNKKHSGTIIGSGTSNSNTGIIGSSDNSIGKDQSSSTSSSPSSTPTSTATTATSTATTNVNNSNKNHQQHTTSTLYPIQTNLSPSSGSSHTPAHANSDDDDFELEEEQHIAGSGDSGIIDRDDDNTDDDDDDDNDDDDDYEDGESRIFHHTVGAGLDTDKHDSDGATSTHTDQHSPKVDADEKHDYFDKDVTPHNYDEHEGGADVDGSENSDNDSEDGTEMYTDVTDPSSSNGPTHKRPGNNNQGTVHELDQTNTINSLPPDTKVVEHTTGNEVLIMNASDDDRTTSFFAQPGILAAVIGGAVVGLLCAILVVMFIVYRMRKKDEGSYALDEPKRSPAVNSYAKNANNREFYA